MDFSAILQLRDKKFWWMDVVLYLAISSLLAAIFCYLIFLSKNNMTENDIKSATVKLQSVGTKDQRQQEEEVVSYQKKIMDFTDLLNKHQLASNVFVFMQAQTMPNVWFKQFSFDENSGSVQLSGVADSMAALSRQIEILEENKHIKSMGYLTSGSGTSGGVGFNISITLDQNIFSYFANASSDLGGLSSGQSTSGSGAQNSSGAITSFNFLLNPAIVGSIDATNHIVVLSVPYGTDVKNLTPSIIVSPGTTILPASNVPQDFTNPVTYTVTAQDGSVQNYTIRVVVAAASNAGNKSS